MGRNEQIILYPVAWAVSVILVSLMVQTYGTSTSAPAWLESIMTSCAVLAAITLPLLTERRRQEQRERTAEVIVASALRSWLRIAAQDVSENLSYRSTGGQDGEEKFDMPALTLTAEQVASMRPRYVREVLSLIERRERRQSDIYAARFYDDDEDGIMEYFEEIAHLFWSMRRVYQEIAHDRDLDESTNRPREIQYIKRAGELASEYRDRGDLGTYSTGAGVGGDRCSNPPPSILCRLGPGHNP